MREDVFVDNIMKHLRDVLPTMTEAYNGQMILGVKWDIAKMQEIIDRYMKSARFRVENGKSKSSREKPTLFKQETNLKKVNDNSREEFNKDAYYDEQQVMDDGQPRADSFSQFQAQKEVLEMQAYQFDGGQGYGGNGYREQYQGYGGGKGYEGKGGGYSPIDFLVIPPE